MKRNYFTGLLHFMRRWDGLTASEAHAGRGNSISRGGRINIEGSETCRTARTYTRLDPEFAEAIEPGVRRLVLTLVEKFDCITYSSCEGHPQMQAGGVPSLRHVGIIPRDAGEYDELLHCFRRAVDACRRLAARRSANVSVVERILSSENIALPCFEILFEREGAGWAAYFSHLEGVYELFIEHLVEEAHARVVQG